jgi:hypothetical protein
MGTRAARNLAPPRRAPARALQHAEREVHGDQVRLREALRQRIEGNARPAAEVEDARRLDADGIQVRGEARADLSRCRKALCE